MPAKLQEKFDALTPREKGIFFVTLLALLWSGWDSLIYGPLTAKQNALARQLAQLDSELRTVRQSTAELEQAANADPNNDNLNKLAQLKAQYDSLQTQLMSGNKKFVSPELMAQALGDMLGHNRLTLTKLETLPPVTLLDTDNQQHPIYKHGLVITFTGSYADTVDYLEALEALPWVIAWDRLDYKVKAYPVAEIKLRTYTLSFEKRWLGV